MARFRIRPNGMTYPGDVAPDEVMPALALSCEGCEGCCEGACEARKAASGLACEGCEGSKPISYRCGGAGAQAGTRAGASRAPACPLHILHTLHKIDLKEKLTGKPLTQGVRTLHHAGEMT